MSLKHAILGFLSFAPFSGYELKKAFDRSIQHFWPGNQSQIYRTLAELDETGLVEKEIVSREERLDMKIYSITAAGRSALHQWLSTPLPEQDQREPFLIQVYFGGKLSNDELIALMRQRLRSTEEKLAVYQAIYHASQNAPSRIADARAVFLSLLTLEAGYVTTRSEADWLRSAIERIETGQYVLKIG